MVDIDKLLKNGRYVDESGQLWIKLHYGNGYMEWNIENVRIKAPLAPGISDKEFRQILDNKLNNTESLV